MSDLPKKLTGLAPSDYNPRRVTSEALGKLKKAMKQFGDLGGIVFNRRTGRLISGHQRTKNMRRDVNIIYPNGETPNAEGDVYGEIVYYGKVFPVRVVDWDEKKEMAANIVANNDAIQGSWDMQALSKLLIDHISYEDAFLTPEDIHESDFSDQQIQEILKKGGVEIDLSMDAVAIDELAQIQEFKEQQARDSKPGSSDNEFKDSIGTEVRRTMKKKDEAISYWRILVGRDDEDIEEFCEDLGIDKHQKYIQTDMLRAWKEGTL